LLACLLDCYEEILEEKLGSLDCQNSTLHSFKFTSGARASTPVLLDIEDDDPEEVYCP
jgi:hypothetical protein